MIAAGGAVQFAYCDRHGRATNRRVLPYRHVHLRARSYMIGYEADRNDWRLFRLDRMIDIEMVAGDARALDFPERSVTEWLLRDFGRHRDTR